MNISQAKQYLPFIQAVAEGKTIQFNSEDGKGWRDCSDEHYPNTSFELWALERGCYRIKPTPQLRPWKPEEVPVGALIHFDEDDSKKLPSIILDVSTDGKVTFCAKGSIMTIELESMIMKGWLHCEHSLDHGKTWLPCGVEE